MARNLTNLKLDEISLVDSPANQHASIVLVKRVAPESLSGYTEGVKPENSGSTDRGAGSVTVEELTKKLEGLQAQVADLTKKAEDAETAKAAAEAAAEALSKSATDAGLEVADGKIVKRAEAEYVEIDGERVEKALVPAPVLKALEKQAADIAALNKRHEEVELAKRGEAELPHLASTALAKGKLLKAVEGDEDMLRALKSADAAMKGATEEKGSGEMDEDEGSPARKLDRMAKTYATEKAVPFETAYNEVTKSGEGYDLLRKMRTTAN